MCESQINSFEKHEWNDGFTANDARILADNVRTELDDKEYNEVSNIIYDTEVKISWGGEDDNDEKGSKN